MVGAACSSSSRNDSARSTAPNRSRTSVASTTSSPTTTSTTVASTTTTATVPPTTTTTAPDPTLRLGSSGPDVAALQQRLLSLGYWLSTANGRFDNSTQQAVYAYQKASGVGADGSVGPVTEAALARGVVPAPQSHSGH